MTERHFEGFSYREFVDARGGDSCGLWLKRKRLAIDLRFRNEIPPVLCFVLDYFVSLCLSNETWAIVVEPTVNCAAHEFNHPGSGKQM